MDRELRSQLNSIQDKLERLAKEVSPKGKQKTSAIKRLTIAIPVIVAIVGLLGTGYELGLKFLENQRNRQTIRFYTSLAKTLVENGDYADAKAYLDQAKAIDPNNADVVSTKAFTDMMDLIRVSVATNPDALTDAIYNLDKLGIPQDEINYHIGLVAAQENKLDIAEEYLLQIQPQPNRYSLRARAKLVGDVYLRSLQSENSLKQPVDEIKRKILETLRGFVPQIQEFDKDMELAGNLREHCYGFGYALLFKLSPDELPPLKEIFTQFQPPNEEFMNILQSRASLARGEVMEQEKVLESLYAVQEKSKTSSPVSERISDAIAQYSAEIQPEESVQTGNTSILETRRLEGKKLRLQGKTTEAQQIFLGIVEEYKQNNLPPDETLYNTYFNLALLNEINLGRIEKAIEYYDQAEKLATRLQLKDPSIYNTFGYLYYRLGRDERDPAKKSDYLSLAQEKLQAALAIDPNYRKSKGTLAAVKDEFSKIEQVKYYQQQVQQIPMESARRR